MGEFIIRSWWCLMESRVKNVVRHQEHEGPEWLNHPSSLAPLCEHLLFFLPLTVYTSHVLNPGV